MNQTQLNSLAIFSIENDVTVKRMIHFDEVISKIADYNV